MSIISRIFCVTTGIEPFVKIIYSDVQEIHIFTDGQKRFRKDPDLVSNNVPNPLHFGVDPDPQIHASH
jgi:hypothetical protein